MAIPAGTLLGRYQVISLLGTGGMGEVYKARDAELGRDVAIKLLPSELKAYPSSQRQLEREARAAAAVTHPHICNLYDLVHEGGFDFIVMELLEGETLAARLCRGPMPIEEVVAVAIDISEALAAAHRRRLIHRDLKPSNVMLTTTHGAKLLDFGIAKIKVDAALNELSDVTPGTGSTRPGVLVGTLQYMSPEQLQGLPIDGRADVFALGAVVYEMLTGCRAFDATTRDKTIAAILESAPAPIGSQRAGVPAALTRIVETCLAKVPSNRWQSADDLARALKVVAARSISGHPKLRRADARPHPTRIRTLAVLPFENVPPTHGQQHVADGLTESLIASISVIGRLKVISRSSVMRYRARETPLQEICRELQVDGVVRGKVCPDAGRLKVSVELLKAPDGASLWREEYDRPATDFFRVQGEIAETIAAEMQLKLTPSERRRFRAKRSADAAANEAYLRGRYYWSRDTPEALRRSFEDLSAAVGRDPDFGAAHAALADWYLSAGLNGLLAEAAAQSGARAAALRALDCDPELAEAYACLGRIAMHELDLQRARAEFETALSLNPSLVEPIVWSARTLSYLGLHGDAVARIERAKQLDPVSPRTLLSACAIYYIADDYERALEEGRKALEFEPHLPHAYYYIGMTHFRRGRIPEALESLARAASESGRHAAAVSGMVVVLIHAGRQTEALPLFDEMKERATRAEVLPYYFAEMYLALGKVDKALEYLRRSYELRIPDMAGLAVDPLFQSLHGHPEFEVMLQSLGLRPALLT